MSKSKKSRKRSIDDRINRLRKEAETATEGWLRSSPQLKSWRTGYYTGVLVALDIMNGIYPEDDDYAFAD